MTKRIFLALAGLFIGLTLSAQSHKVTLRLQDAATGENVGFATVSLVPEKGQAKYTLSDSEGKATLEKIRNGKYTLKAEIMGYITHQQALEMKGAIFHTSSDTETPTRFQAPNPMS